MPGIGDGHHPRLEHQVAAQVDNGLADHGGDRQREQRAGDPVDLVADQQRQDDQDRVDPQRDPEHLRRDEVTLELLQRDEQQHHPKRADRVVEQRDQRPPAAGPMIGPMYGMNSISP